MGEIVDSLPARVEISVTFSILSFGVLVIACHIQPAINIEERFEALQDDSQGEA